MKRAPLKRSVRLKKATRSRLKSKKVKPPSLSKLKKEADRIFSLWVRKSNANPEGIVSCYTCPFKAHWKKIQNGHLVSRYYLATRYDERNCRPQCITCNIWRNGMTPHFAEKLEQELGTGIVGELYALARELRTHFDYENIIDLYTQKLSTLDPKLLESE